MRTLEYASFSIPSTTKCPRSDNWQPDLTRWRIELFSDSVKLVSKTIDDIIIANTWTCLEEQKGYKWKYLVWKVLYLILFDKELCLNLGFLMFNLTRIKFIFYQIFFEYAKIKVKFTLNWLKHGLMSVNVA